MLVSVAFNVRRSTRLDEAGRNESRNRKTTDERLYGGEES
jgi:hypothetical protein